MKSRVHPAYKTKSRVKNWASYDRALGRRGDVTVWLSPEAIAGWEPEGIGKRGGQLKYSDLASSRSAARVQCPKLDDRPWPASVVRHRSLKGRGAGIVAGQFRFMHQRPTATRYEPWTRRNRDAGKISSSRLSDMSPMMRRRWF